MADEDMFGDEELFAEFDKEREPSGSFLIYEKTEDGKDDQSKFVFQVSDESSSDDSDVEDEGKAKVQEPVTESMSDTVQRLLKDSNENGINSSQNGDYNEEEEIDDTPVVSKDRQNQMSTYKLTYERNKYKRYCNIIDSTRFIQSEESAAVQILFQNNSFSRKYKTQIEEYIKSLIDTDMRGEHETLQKLDLKSSVPSCSDINDKLSVEKRTNRMYQSHAIIGCTQFYNHFVIDTLGWPLVEYNPSLTESWDIPVYELIMTDVLPLDEAECKAATKRAEKKKNSCWNCGGDHMLNDCTEPRDQRRISEARNAMMASAQQPSGPKSARYHKEATQNEDSKYGKFKPGVISDTLREALGLKPHQLPLHIYMMRILGYPPGWMEEAKSAPGLSMFDKDGNDVDNDMEEGEEPPGPTLNVEKIIEYPGFTVEPPSNIIDESDQMGYPPLQQHQLKATLLAHTQMQEAMKRQLEEDEEDISTKRQKLDTSDMDLDDESGVTVIGCDPPLPPDTPPGRPPMPLSTPPPTPDENSRQSSKQLSRESSTGRSDSPTLAELEEKYQLLQKTLNESGDDNDMAEIVVLDSCDDDSQSSEVIGEKSSDPIEIDSVNDGDDSTCPIEIANDSIDSTEDFEFIKPQLNRVGSVTSIQTFGELGTGSPASSNPGTPVHNPFPDDKPSFKGTVSVSKNYGTPILKRAGSIDTLPSDSKFSQGIEDHIPFENLPEATGRFGAIRKIVDKIRKINPMGRKKKK
ncbi:Zinc finger CCHC domain-containing protein 8 [Mactra antiquata]